jgi:hypothetical protein
MLKKTSGLAGGLVNRKICICRRKKTISLFQNLNTDLVITDQIWNKNPEVVIMT